MLSGRSYPSFGAEAQFETGYNQKLWGEGPGKNRKNVLYGLIRPSFAVATSAVINTTKARLELYPISFIGIVYGHEDIRSEYDKFTFFDCDKTRCKGSIIRDYFQARMALGAGPLVFSGLLERARNSYSADSRDADNPPGEFRFVTLVNPKNDEYYRAQYVLGLKTRIGTLVGVTEYVHFDRSRQFNKMNILGLTGKYKKNNIWLLGAGTFESSHVAEGGIIVFQIKRSFIRSSQLF